jgi:cytochrome c peroxidase
LSGGLHLASASAAIAPTVFGDIAKRYAPTNICKTISRLAIFAVALTSTAWAEQPDSDRRCGGEPCDAVFRGLFAFFDRDLHDANGNSLDGNGRSCNDCHMATERFRLTPAIAEKRFQLLQRRLTYNPNADDPLFRPIDADDFRSNGDQANDYSNLRHNGLIRVTLALPPNIKLIDPLTNQPSAETTVDVWRKVPSVFDVKLTGADGINPWFRGPNKTGGYQHDGRFLTLQEQALGALVAHAQVQGPPQQQTLDDLNSFQRVLFSNERVRAIATAIDAGLPAPEADPPLNTLEQQGKAVFTRACAQCHGGPGQSTTLPPAIRFHDVFTQCPRPVDALSPARFNLTPCSPELARNARTYEITLPNGTMVRRTSSDPGRALLTGFVGLPAPQDDWNKLDVPGLRDLRRGAPYFHNNSANTLEEVVDHYIEFFKRVKVNAVPGVAPPIASTDGVNFDRTPRPEERDALLAYLRKL